MKYLISDIEERVYALLDENKTIADELVEFADPGTSVSALIRVYLPEAARMSVLELPLADFDECNHLSLTIHPAKGRTQVDLPADFLRLVNFRMDTWDYGLSTPLVYNSDSFRLHCANYARGGKRRSRPAVSIFSAGDRNVMYVFGITEGSSSAEFDYLAKPIIEDDIVEIPAGAFDDVCRRIADAIKQNLQRK